MVFGIFTKFVEIVAQFWYYGTRIEQECLRKNGHACRNAVCGIKWEMSVPGNPDQPCAHLALAYLAHGS